MAQVTIPLPTHHLACLLRFAALASPSSPDSLYLPYMRAAPTEKFSGNRTIYLSTATNSFSQARQQTPLHELLIHPRVNAGPN